MNDRLSILCCPVCKGDLRPLRQIRTPPGCLKSAVLVCGRCNDVAGVVRNFKYDFIHFDRDAARRRLHHTGHDRPVQLGSDVIEATIGFDDPQLVLQGSWEQWDGKYQLSHGREGDELSYTGEFLDVGVRLLKHPWSGHVRFEVDGHPAGTADLYETPWSTIRWIRIATDLEPGRHTVRIIPTGQRNAAASACQVLFHELVIVRPGRPSDTPPAMEDENRVLPVFPAVVDLMKAAPANGCILDCGSGDRALADPRCIGMDFYEYQLPHVYGDAMNLPFKSDTFDLVFSQAVLEHVRNPFRVVEEMRRVTKPGGTVWAGMAFLQPVHAVPSHYFNATAWGIEELFRDLQIVNVSWFGELSFTIDWLFQTAGVAAKADRAEYAALMERVKALDKLISYEELKAVASGVAVHAVKNLG